MQIIILVSLCVTHKRKTENTFQQIKTVIKSFLWSKHVCCHSTLNHHPRHFCEHPQTQKYQILKLHKFKVYQVITVHSDD